MVGAVTFLALFGVAGAYLGGLGFRPPHILFWAAWLRMSHRSCLRGLPWGMFHQMWAVAHSRNSSNGISVGGLSVMVLWVLRLRFGGFV